MIPTYDLSATVCKVSFPVLAGERRRPTLTRTDVSPRVSMGEQGDDLGDPSPWLTPSAQNGSQGT